MVLYLYRIKNPNQRAKEIIMTTNNIAREQTAAEGLVEYGNYMSSWMGEGLISALTALYENPSDFFDNTYAIYEEEGGKDGQVLRKLDALATDDLIAKFFLDNQQDIITLFNKYVEESSLSDVLTSVKYYSGFCETEHGINMQAMVNSAELASNRELMVALSLYVVSKYSVEYCKWRRRLLNAAGDDAAYFSAMDDAWIEHLSEEYGVSDYCEVLPAAIKRKILNAECNILVNDLRVATKQDGTIVKGLDCLQQIADYTFALGNNSAGNGDQQEYPPVYGNTIRGFIEYLGEWNNEQLTHAILARHDGDTGFIFSSHSIVQEREGEGLAGLRAVKGFLGNNSLIELFTQNQVAIVDLINNYAGMKGADHMLWFFKFYAGFNASKKGVDLQALNKTDNFSDNQELMIAMVLVAASIYAVAYIKFYQRKVDEDVYGDTSNDDYYVDEAHGQKTEKLIVKYGVHDIGARLEITVWREILNTEMNLCVDDQYVIRNQQGAVVDGLWTLSDIGFAISRETA